MTRGLPLGALLATLLLVRATAAGAAVTVRATLDPPRVPVGQSSDLSVEVRGTQSSPAPRIGPIDGLSISYVGPATQLSIVNGQTSASITHHFAVTPQREGTFTIGPITVQADGQSMQTGSVTLQTASAGAGGGAPAPATDPLTLELRAQSRTVYLHERLPLTLTLRIGDVRVADLQYPQVPGDGFALEAFPQPTQRQDTRDGTAYQIVEFDGALTPLRTGSVTVGPATISLTTLSERATRRGFFFGGTVRQPREVLSQPLVLDVLPLPETGKPADFSGAVGRFMLEVKAAPLDVTAGDPVTLTYSLHGEGDLSSATPPALVGSDTLRVYPVQGVASPPTAPAGSRTFEQVVIPQRPGSVRLPLPRFSFFDPQARAYRVAETQPITLTVRAAPAAATTPQIVGAPAPRAAKPAEQVGHDIVFIKDTPGTLASPDVPLWRSPLFWLLLVIPPLVWLAALLIDRRRLRLGTDVRYARFTRAGRTARAALHDARAALTQGDAAIFYDRVARAVSDYLAAKLDLPPGGVTPEEMGARLRDVGLPGEVADELRAFLASCEEVRFAPAAGDGDMRRTLSRAESLVRALERSRHLGRAAAAVLLLLIAAGASAATDNPQAMFFRANSLYADGRYAEAAAEYEHVLGTGVASANVYFNLGNAYLKAGDVGRAVLAYERARRLAPGDPDVRANLAFAREQNGEDDEPPRWTRVAFPLATVWPSDTVLAVAAAAWWALFLLLAARYLLPAARRALGWAVLAAGVLFAVSGTSAAYRLWTVDFRREAVVVASTPVAVRFEPTSAGTVHFRAMTGSRLRLLGDERDGWVQVARPDGLRGWVERDAVGSL